eukprot:7246658-Prymnesium_polylepis.1
MCIRDRGARPRARRAAGRSADPPGRTAGRRAKAAGRAAAAAAADRRPARPAGWHHVGARGDDGDDAADADRGPVRLPPEAARTQRPRCTAGAARHPRERRRRHCG